MKNKLELTGYIRCGHLEFDMNQDTRFFFENNDGKDVAISIKLGGDSVAFWQHKFYRGFLLPCVANESYSDNEQLAHFSMKKMFLLRYCNGIADIPKEYIERAILIAAGDDIMAYIPSTGDLSYQDMAKFILDVEGLMLEFMPGLDSEGKKARDKAFELKQ